MKRGIRFPLLAKSEEVLLEKGYVVLLQERNKTLLEKEV